MNQFPADSDLIKTKSLLYQFLDVLVCLLQDWYSFTVNIVTPVHMNIQVLKTYTTEDNNAYHSGSKL